MTMVLGGRYNLMPGEDLQQNRSFHTITQFMASMDCEDFAQNCICQVKTFMHYKNVISCNPQVTLGDLIYEPLHKFEVGCDNFLGLGSMPDDEMTHRAISLVQTFDHFARQIKTAEVKTVASNAHSGQAESGSGNQGGENLVGHCYAIASKVFEPAVGSKPVVLRSISEGTKWADTFNADTGNIVCRNGSLNPEQLQVVIKHFWPNNHPISPRVLYHQRSWSTIRFAATDPPDPLTCYTSAVGQPMLPIIGRGYQDGQHQPIG